MTAVLFASDADDPVAWRQAIERRLPGVEFRVFPECGEPAEIAAAIVWRYPPGALGRFPNLKLICSLGAGVDHIFGDPGLPPGVPLTRVVDPDLTQAMSEYVLLAVLRYHRQLPLYAAQQRARRWTQLERPVTSARRVGILGLGVLGRDAAGKLRALGFPVAAWTRRPRTAEGIEIFAGEAAFAAFLARTEILVCLLPLNSPRCGRPRGAGAGPRTAAGCSRRSGRPRSPGW